MKCSPMEQQRRFAQIENPVNASNNNVVVAPRVPGFNLTFQMSDTTVDNRNTAQARLGFNAGKLIGPGLGKFHGHGLLISCQDIDDKWIAHSKTIKTGGVVRNAPKNQRWVEGQRIKRTGGNADLFTVWGDRRHRRHAGAKLAEGIAKGQPRVVID